MSVLLVLLYTQTTVDGTAHVCLVQGILPYSSHGYGNGASGTTVICNVRSILLCFVLHHLHGSFVRLRPTFLIVLVVYLPVQALPCFSVLVCARVSLVSNAPVCRSHFERLVELLNRHDVSHQLLIRTRDGPKRSCIPLCLQTVAGSEYCVSRMDTYRGGKIVFRTGEWT